MFTFLMKASIQILARITSAGNAHGLRAGAAALFAAFCLAVGPMGAIAEAPAAAEVYRLHAGDEVAISVLPQKAYDCGGVLLPDGLITLKNIGTLKAAGLTLPELAETLKKALSDRLVSPRVLVTIVKLHEEVEEGEPSVTVTGAVSRPGAQPLSRGLQARRAVEIAGVILAKADLTRVAIRHKDLTRVVVDLSTRNRIGDPAHNLLLEDGDSIEVPTLPVRGITVLGAVARPGSFEFLEGMRVHKALEQAGGNLAGADLSRVTIRHQDLSRREADLSSPDTIADPDRNPALKDGDTIEVPLRAAPDARVRIRGEVANPGRYEYRPSMTLEDLIQAAGKLTPLADIEHVQLQRPDQPLQTIDLIAQQKLGLAGDIRLQPDDDVFIVEQKDTVLLLGAVPRPGRMPIRPGQTLVDFFTQGTADTAALVDPGRVNLRDVRVIREGKETTKVNVTAILTKKSSRSKDVALKPGDVIYLPPIVTNGTKKTPLDYVSYLNQARYLTGTGVN